MKYVILFLAVLAVSSCQKEKTLRLVPHSPSKIDSLKTNREVSDYLIAIDSNYEYFRLKPPNELSTLRNDAKDSIMKLVAKEWGIDKSFYKADFDNNGYIDLIIIGGWPVTSTSFDGEVYQYSYFAIMNYGNKAAKIIDIHKAKDLFVLPEIKESNEGVYITLHKPDNINDKKPRIADTISSRIIYKYAGFCEYNKNPANRPIQKIELATTGCYGTCPIFQITINKDKSAYFIARYFNYNKDRKSFNIKEEGFFKSAIKDTDFNALTDLVNYIDFKTIRDEYSVNWTDDQTAVLKITYADGTIKNVNDYGMSGTYGLRTLYQFMSDLRFNQKWEKAAEPDNVRLPVSHKWEE